MVGEVYLIRKFVAMEKFIALPHTQMGGAVYQTMNSETTEKSTEQFLILEAGGGLADFEFR